jgi:hypothetical protein
MNKHMPCWQAYIRKLSALVLEIVETAALGVEVDGGHGAQVRGRGVRAFNVDRLSEEFQTGSVKNFTDATKFA